MTDAQRNADNFGANAWLVDDMYEQYRQDPQSVSESWRDFFEDYRPGGANLARPSSPEVKAAGRRGDHRGSWSRRHRRTGHRIRFPPACPPGSRRREPRASRPPPRPAPAPSRPGGRRPPASGPSGPGDVPPSGPTAASPSRPGPTGAAEVADPSAGGGRPHRRQHDRQPGRPDRDQLPGHPGPPARGQPPHPQQPAQPHGQRRQGELHPPHRVRRCRGPARPRR